MCQYIKSMYFEDKHREFSYTDFSFFNNESNDVFALLNRYIIRQFMTCHFLSLHVYFFNKQNESAFLLALNLIQLMYQRSSTALFACKFSIIIRSSRVRGHITNSKRLPNMSSGIILQELIYSALKSQMNSKLSNKAPISYQPQMAIFYTLMPTRKFWYHFTKNRLIANRFNSFSTFASKLIIKMATLTKPLDTSSMKSTNII